MQASSGPTCRGLGPLSPTAGAERLACCQELGLQALVAEAVAGSKPAPTQKRKAPQARSALCPTGLNPQPSTPQLC